jgi:hypothetical protein
MRAGYMPAHCLGPHYGQSREELEVANIRSRDAKSQLQSGRSNEQILKSQHNAASGLFTFDSSSESCDFDSNWIDGNVPDELVDKCLPSEAALLLLRSLNAMNHFHNRYYGKPHFDLAVRGPKLFEDLQNGMASTLAGNNDARVKN